MSASSTGGRDRDNDANRPTSDNAREPEDSTESEENLHERLHLQRHPSLTDLRQPPNQEPLSGQLSDRFDENRISSPPRHHRRHHHHHHQPNLDHLPSRHKDRIGHKKELIKPDPSEIRHRHKVHLNPTAQQPVALMKQARPGVVVAIDEDQLQRRLAEARLRHAKSLSSSLPSSEPLRHQHRRSLQSDTPVLSSAIDRKEVSSSSSSSSSSRTSSSKSESKKALNQNAPERSPPPAAIIIPPSVVKSLSARRTLKEGEPFPQSTQTTALGSGSTSGLRPTNMITREQLNYGSLLRKGEVQVLYRSPDSDSLSSDRHMKEDQVAPGQRQSPIALLSLNPAYDTVNKPLILDYPPTIENLRLSNTGFSWKVKVPYQSSMATALHGAQLSKTARYRLDQFHCHWGLTEREGSEHTVDNHHYSAELHFVHYNMEKYHTMSKAARHPDGLVVVSVFLNADDQQTHNHAELEKVVSNMRPVQLKGEQTIIRQAIRIENLLPANKSYWSYHGSLTTPPYYESVTWFILKHPIKCSKAQIDKFRSLKSSLRHQVDSEDEDYIKSNHRKTQPINGRTIFSYDEPVPLSNRLTPTR